MGLRYVTITIEQFAHIDEPHRPRWVDTLEDDHVAVALGDPPFPARPRDVDEHVVHVHGYLLSLHDVPLPSDTKFDAALQARPVTTRAWIVRVTEPPR